MLENSRPLSTHGISEPLTPQSFDFTKSLLDDLVHAKPARRVLVPTGGNCIGGLVLRVISNVPAAHDRTPQCDSQLLGQPSPPSDHGMDIR